MKKQIKDDNVIKIALIGKVNSGKSTLFNRLIEKEKAISFQKAGTTRDRNYGICNWDNKKFEIIDTGGLTKKPDIYEIDKQVEENIKAAIKEADIIFFVTEIKNLNKLDDEGTIITDFERNITKIVKKSKKPNIFILNKADNPKKREWKNDNKWKSLGLGEPIAISSINGSGIGDLLDFTIEKTKNIKTKNKIKNLDESIKVSIVGKPNAGKSSLFNAIIGKKQVITSSIPHTTRGPQDTFFIFENPKEKTKTPITLIDTAGIRKQRKINSSIEKIGVQRSLKAMRKSDVIIIIIQANTPPTSQDKALTRLAIQSKKGIVIAINKCDLLTKKEYKILTNSNLTFNKLPMAKFASRVFVSAKKSEGINTLIKAVIEAHKNQTKQIDDEKLNKFLDNLVEKRNFKQEVWKRIKISQTGTNPIEFSLICPKIIIKRRQVKKPHFNIIKKAIREKWVFDGAPIFIKIT